MHVDEVPAGSILAIAWERHRRMECLCEGISVPLLVMTHAGRQFSRYWVLTIETIRALRKIRPKVLLVQNPSLVLTLLACLLRPFFNGYFLIVDAHNEAVEPFIYTRWMVPRLARLLLRCADLTIVTNSYLKKKVEAVGGNAFVLPDRLPTPPIKLSSAPQFSGALKVMVVSTYAPDEPIKEILEAAATLGQQFSFRVTGRDSKLPEELRRKVPENVVLTGYLAEENYWELMFDSHFVLDLTLMPNCLVCGAYEALALGRPLILTNNEPTSDLFGAVAVLAEPSAKGIQVALMRAKDMYEKIAMLVPAERHKYEKMWEERASALMSHLRDGRGVGSHSSLDLDGA